MKITKVHIAVIALTLFLTTGNALSQEAIINRDSVRSILDSLGKTGKITSTQQEKPVIKFTESQAVKFLKEKYQSDDWYRYDDPLRSAMGELIFIATHQPYDSLKNYLHQYSYDSIDMPWIRFYKWDTLRMKVPVIIPAPFTQPHDTVPRKDTLEARNLLPDSLKAYQPVKPPVTVIMKDTVFLVASNVYPEVPRYRNSQPFKTYRYPYQADSISAAVKTVTDHLQQGDSTLIRISDIGRSSMPVWLNSKRDRMVRYWLKNEVSDSVILWIGSTGRDSLGLYLEEGIIFKRPVKQTNISNAQLDLKKVNSGKLLEVDKAFIKPRYWKLRSETNFILSQTYLTNWASGGQSSVSVTLDAIGFADYKNDNLKITSNNYVRLKYGLVKPGQEKIRTSTDLLETNSKVNHKAFGKFDLSAIMLFKTQVTKNYDYPANGDRVDVSNFMSPASLTIGLGLDYKPFKKTSINFSPLAYKATFVLDTVTYDQTKYGIPKDKKVLQEPGISVQVSNTYSPFKTLTLVNRLQLFTNYIKNPQNIVVDWEMIAALNLNWFTELRLNTHLVYDDKVLIPQVNHEGNPIIGSDGKQVTGKRVQFKEILGISLVFRF